MEPEKIQEELKKANFNLLKVSLHNYIKTNFKVCDGFLTELDKCTDDNVLTRLFVKYNDEVYDRLGGDSNLEDEIDNLNCRIRSLEYDNETLESQLATAEIAYGVSLDDKLKKEFIVYYHKEYTPWEIEDLLKNGKKYLSK